MRHLKWVELDPEAPAHNISELRRCASGSGVRFCAVVKANAYGHGIAEMLPLLGSADWLAVNSLDEGLELRSLGERRPILLLGHVLTDRLAEALDADLRLTVYNRETVRELSGLTSAGRRARVHLKLETGTGRQGVLEEDLPALVGMISEEPWMDLEGLSTHFANIEDTLNHDYAQGQLDRFLSMRETVLRSGGSPGMCHTACTAASILFPETHFDMLRAGIGIYGLWPSRETFLSASSGPRPVPDLRPVMSLRTRIAQVKEMPAGSYIGYGCTYRTGRRTLLGVLPVGYSDGYDRGLGNTAHVLVRGRRAPVLGRICMNLTMVDLTDVPGAGLQDEVVLLGRDGEEEVTAEMVAEWSGTINYEVVTRVSPLLPRVVTGG